MTVENQKTSITLKSLELDAFLGWPEAERNEKQRINVDIHIQFAKPPIACFTDELDDTYCYDALVEAIHKTVSAKSYRLIEHLGHEIYQTIKQLVPEAAISINLKKQPPIPTLSGGVAFYFGD